MLSLSTNVSERSRKNHVYHSPDSCLANEGAGDNAADLGPSCIYTTLNGVNARQGGHRRDQENSLHNEIFRWMPVSAIMERAITSHSHRQTACGHDMCGLRFICVILRREWVRANLTPDPCVDVFF